MYWHRDKSIWFRIYLVLVALNIAVIVGGAYLSSTIKYNYTQSIEANHHWVDRLSRYAELTRLAGSVNAPGNDVFDSRRMEAEIQRRDQAREAFETGMADARADLLLHVSPDDAGPLLAWLEAAANAMRRMLGASDLIFRHFGQGDTELAAAHMAGMDRHYAEVAAMMAALSHQVGKIQSREFRQQMAAMRQLEALELAVGSLLVVMFSGVTFYGYKIVQKLSADEEKLARYSVSLAEARDAADASNRAKSDFVAVMSHEIRTPLTTVMGMADLVAAEELPERTRTYVQAIQASGRHLLAIVNDVLDLSRIEAVGLTLEEADFQVVDLLEQVHWLMAPAAAERGIDLFFDADIEPGTIVRGDSTRLRQVLLNLVSNAVKFTPSGHVRVEVRHRPAGPDRLLLQVQVEDTGIGIPEDRQARLFLKFSQVSDRTERHYGGSGLGLAICRRLVEAMGGGIGVESHPGKGSRFWFEVPFALGDRQAVEEKVEFGPGSCAPRRILIVDDAEANRLLLADVLSRQGHEVIGAADGLQALELVRQGRFDLVLMDVQMPVMDGIEAARRIRTLPGAARDVPVVGLTANVLEEERQRCFAAGMSHCLSKPFVWADLFQVISQVAGGPPAADAGEQPILPASLPLFDRFGVHMAADGKAGQLLRQVMEDAERSYQRLAAMAMDREELLRETHKLKGTSGLFGLKRIRLAADQLHEAATDDRDLEEAMDVLARAVAATRGELQETGLVAADPAAPGPAGGAEPAAVHAGQGMWSGAGFP